jgi:hypothetical protein
VPDYRKSTLAFLAIARKNSCEQNIERFQTILVGPEIREKNNSHQEQEGS